MRCCREERVHAGTLDGRSIEERYAVSRKKTQASEHESLSLTLGPMCLSASVSFMSIASSETRELTLLSHHRHHSSLLSCLPTSGHDARQRLTIITSSSPLKKMPLALALLASARSHPLA